MFIFQLSLSFSLFFFFFAEIKLNMKNHEFLPSKYSMLDELHFTAV
jgi:hypothetical protein